MKITEGCTGHLNKESQVWEGTFESLIFETESQWNLSEETSQH